MAVVESHEDPWTGGQDTHEGCHHVGDVGPSVVEDLQAAWADLGVSGEVGSGVSGEVGSGAALDVQAVPLVGVGLDGNAAATICPQDHESPGAVTASGSLDLATAGHEVASAQLAAPCQEAQVA